MSSFSRGSSGFWASALISVLVISSGCADEATHNPKGRFSGGNGAGERPEPSASKFSLETGDTLVLRGSGLVEARLHLDTAINVTRLNSSREETSSSRPAGATEGPDWLLIYADEATSDLLIQVACGLLPPNFRLYSLSYWTYDARRSPRQLDAGDWVIVGNTNGPGWIQLEFGGSDRKPWFAMNASNAFSSVRMISPVASGSMGPGPVNISFREDVEFNHTSLLLGDFWLSNDHYFVYPQELSGSVENARRDSCVRSSTTTFSGGITQNPEISFSALLAKGSYHWQGKFRAALGPQETHVHLHGEAVELVTSS